MPVSDRASTLEVPAGAGRGPLLLVLAVLLLAAVSLVVGLTLGWFVLLLAPALLLSVWIAWSVVAAMRRAREGGGEE